MSWLSDVLGFFGGGGRAEATATTTNATTVTVSPNIINAIDTAPIGNAAQSLVNAMTGTLAPAVASIGASIKEASAAEKQKVETLQEIATWVSVAGLAFALVRMVRA